MNLRARLERLERLTRPAALLRAMLDPGRLRAFNELLAYRGDDPATRAGQQDAVELVRLLRERLDGELAHLAGGRES